MTLPALDRVPANDPKMVDGKPVMECGFTAMDFVQIIQLLLRTVDIYSNIYQNL